MSHPARKTQGVRREPGGLMRAVLMLVGDGYAHSSQIARVLDISIDNANGALSRLFLAELIRREPNDIPVNWSITAAGKRLVADDDQWMDGE